MDLFILSQFLCMYACMHMYIYIYVIMYMHMYISMCKCTCIHVCIYKVQNFAYILMYLYTWFAILVPNLVLLLWWHNISMPSTRVNSAYRLTIHPMYRVSMWYWYGIICMIWGGMHGYCKTCVWMYVLMHVCMYNLCLDNPQMCTMLANIVVDPQHMHLKAATKYREGNSMGLIHSSGKWRYWVM